MMPYIFRQRERERKRLISRLRIIGYVYVVTAKKMEAQAHIKDFT